jgi:hypothetical protein
VRAGSDAAASAVGVTSSVSWQLSDQKLCQKSATHHAEVIKILLYPYSCVTCAACEFVFFCITAFGLRSPDQMHRQEGSLQTAARRQQRENSVKGRRWGGGGGVRGEVIRMTLHSPG